MDRTILEQVAVLHELAVNFSFYTSILLHKSIDASKRRMQRDIAAHSQTCLVGLRP